MKDWTKIQTFDRIYQAELCKDILERNEIEAAVLNARDSLFLIGEIELYVKTENVAKAKALIDEFEGLSKINSFILPEPIIKFKDYLAQQGIDSILKKKEDSKYILENFELYVKNEDLIKIIPILTGEKFEGWIKTDSCEHTRQARFRIEILAEKNIDSIIIKKKNSNYHLEEVQIWVENKNAKKANELLIMLNGWIKIKEFNKQYRADIREDFLGKHKIRSIIKKIDENNFELYVECHNEEKAIEIINQHKHWIAVESYDNLIKAEFFQKILNDNGIDAVIVSKKESSLFQTEYVLFADEDDIDKSKKIISEIPKSEE
jgi:hypothetical protein